MGICLLGSHIVPVGTQLVISEGGRQRQSDIFGPTQPESISLLTQPRSQSITHSRESQHCPAKGINNPPSPAHQFFNLSVLLPKILGWGAGAHAQQGPKWQPQRPDNLAWGKQTGRQTNRNLRKLGRLMVNLKITNFQAFGMPGPSQTQDNITQPNKKALSLLLRNMPLPVCSCILFLETMGVQQLCTLQNRLLRAGAWAQQSSLERH